MYGVCANARCLLGLIWCKVWFLIFFLQIKVLFIWNLHLSRDCSYFDLKKVQYPLRTWKISILCEQVQKEKIKLLVQYLSRNHQIFTFKCAKIERDKRQKNSYKMEKLFIGFALIIGCKYYSIVFGWTKNHYVAYSKKKNRRDDVTAPLERVLELVQRSRSNMIIVIGLVIIFRW